MIGIIIATVHRRTKQTAEANIKPNYFSSVKISPFVPIDTVKYSIYVAWTVK